MPRPDERPATLNELAHLEALRITLRLKEWPAEDSRERVLAWVRMVIAESERVVYQRNRAKKRAASRRKREAAQKDQEKD